MSLKRCVAHHLMRKGFCLKRERLLLIKCLRFQISLARQVSNDDEEFYQVHLDIFYKSTSENAEFSESIWDEDLDENIFDYIRNSEVFAYAKDKECLKVKIYLDEI